MRQNPSQKTIPITTGGRRKEETEEEEMEEEEKEDGLYSNICPVYLFVLISGHLFFVHPVSNTSLNLGSWRKEHRSQERVRSTGKTRTGRRKERRTNEGRKNHPKSGKTNGLPVLLKEVVKGGSGARIIHTQLGCQGKGRKGGEGVMGLLKHTVSPHQVFGLLLGFTPPQVNSVIQSVIQSDFD